MQIFFNNEQEEPSFLRKLRNFMFGDPNRPSVLIRAVREKGLEFAVACPRFDEGRLFSFEGTNNDGVYYVVGNLKDGKIVREIFWDFRDAKVGWTPNLDLLYPRYSFGGYKSIPQLSQEGVPWDVIDEIAHRNLNRADKKYKKS